MKKKYPTWKQASDAAQKLNIKSRTEYLDKYKKDPRLPANPDTKYKSIWKKKKSWPGFLNIKVNTFYTNWKQASKAAIKLGISSNSEYKARYTEDPRLPSAPDVKYRPVWKKHGGIAGFLGQEIKKLYPTWIQASNASIKLGIKKAIDYPTLRKEDKRLCSQPHITYKNDWVTNGKWIGFLKMESSMNYTTWLQASYAAKELGIKNAKEYSVRYKEDPMLPSSPDEKYSSEWVINGGIDGFLRLQESNLYLTWSQASQAIKKLNIKTVKDYINLYKKDPRLPERPSKAYKIEWAIRGKWPGFLGQKKSKFYSSLKKASTAVKNLNIISRESYKTRYKEDPKLPSQPSIIYEIDWNNNGAWHGYLGQNINDEYPNWGQASIAAKKLNIKNASNYKSQYKKDPRLPATPSKVYKSEWKQQGEWHGFLGHTLTPLYLSWIEASKATQKLGITSSIEYRKLYRNDPCLPSTPAKRYKNEWVKNGNWHGFLLPITCNTLNEAKQYSIVSGIKNSKEYRTKQKEHPLLPFNPDRVYKNEWTNWYEFLNIPKPYSYKEAYDLISKLGFTEKTAFLKYVTVLNDPRLPRTPDQVYESEWINWYVFLGKDEPFKVDCIHKPYTEWAKSINSFLKTAKGGRTKESHLCRFVRLYIQKNELAQSPSEFLTTDKIDYRQLYNFIDDLSSVNIGIRIITTMNQYFDHIIRTELTIEDDETGELATVMNAKNPFTNFHLDKSIQNNFVNETKKPKLAYQYVKKARLWMIPSKARSFKDLDNIHKFESDWLEVDPHIIDKNDPDCVYKIESGVTKLWNPIHWLHTYTLISIPARGRQIAYNDSGESDEFIPKIKHGKVLWVNNFSKLAIKGRQVGFIKPYPDSQFGMQFTTNKTSNSQKGYAVPWMPYELAYWIIRLKLWQEKYNPLLEPTLWSDCCNTHLNEKQLISKGSNCFLFRDFNKQEPGAFSDRLSRRLAAALYNSQPNDLTLAEHNGKSDILSHYHSEYTPHTMRVSLITAYIMEFGLSVETIMKVAGHSSIIMTIYYLKTNSEDFRHKFAEGEKLALKNKAYATQRMIEQKRIDEIKHDLISNSDVTLQSLTNKIPSGNFLFRDYGICPTAGLRCDDGGEFIKQSKIRQPVINGYLGAQNCLQCRHFVTGPAFLGGLLSISNEISLQANHQAVQYNELQSASENISMKIEALDKEEYDAIKNNIVFDETQRNNINLHYRKAQSEEESAAKKLNMLLCDLQAATRLLKQSHALINEPLNSQLDNTKFQLVTMPDHELHISIDETSYYQQLCEVCENAEIYESASGDLAISPRSQLLDKMAMQNNLQPRFFNLTQKQQLIVGNQMSKLLLSRLKTWENVDALIEGRIRLNDLLDHERIDRKDIDLLFKQPKSDEMEVLI